MSNGDTNCQVMADGLRSHEVHTKDKKKKATAKDRKSHKGDIDPEKYKTTVITDKERKQWLADIQQDIDNSFQEQINKRRELTDYEDAEICFFKSYNRERTDFFKKQIAGRVGRGIVSHSAARRLAREILKLERDPSWGVSAKPISDSLLKWHCNLAAPGGVTGKGVLHVELDFPPTYPACPPKVKILGADVDHPNIFGSYICMDLLNDGEFSTAEHTLKPFTGWSAAYGIQTLLIQLQSFFFSGVDTGDGKGDYIRIKPHTAESTWEYQLQYSECKHWSDFVFDQYSFCMHRGAVPGKCKYSWCDGMGLWGPKWVKMHRNDIRTLETHQILYKKSLERDEADEGRTEFEAPKYRIFKSNDMVFSRSLPKPRDITIVTDIQFATKLNVDMSAYHESKKFNAAPYLSTELRVEVAFGSQKYSTRKFSLACKIDGNSILPQVAGPSTPAWYEQALFKKSKSYNKEVLTFTVVNISPRGRDVIGFVNVQTESLTEKSQELVLKLLPPPTKQGIKSNSKSGSCGSLIVKLKIIQPAPRNFSYDFKPNGLTGTMVQLNQFDEERIIRRRKGYRCPECDHTPIKPVPELPSAVDCDDAPPFALAEFHAALTDSVGDNPQAIAAIDRCVNSLQEELDEKKGSKV